MCLSQERLLVLTVCIKEISRERRGEPGDSLHEDGRKPTESEEPFAIGYDTLNNIWNSFSGGGEA